VIALTWKRAGDGRVPDRSSLLTTTTEGDVTSLTAAGGEVTHFCRAAAGWPERYCTLGGNRKFLFLT